MFHPDDVETSVEAEVGINNTFVHRPYKPIFHNDRDPYICYGMVSEANLSQVKTLYQWWSFFLFSWHFYLKKQ